jgi:PTH1 family peptidyl-tRNA hydrolase
MDFLIAGLGNYAAEYVNTRHNVGFDIVDILARRFDASFASARYAETADFKHKGRAVTLLKPTTYMNLSGKAIRYWLSKVQVTPDRLLVVVDEINLPLGAIRLRPDGSDGGHNGLASVIELIGTNRFARLRFGIGNDFPKGYQSDYVLGTWTAEELEGIRPRLEAAADAAMAFVLTGIERAMNNYNKS